MSEYIKKRVQTDDRWKNTTIGDTPYTVGALGCLITTISNASGGGTSTHPSSLAKELRYNSGANLLWDSIDDYSKLKLDFKGRYYGMDDRDIRDYLKKDTRRVLLEVPWYGAKHWINVRSYSKDRAAFKCHDVWDGQTKYVKQYTGYAIVKKK